MFYPSYDDYMRDVFYFNGLSNPNRAYGFQNSNNEFMPQNQSNPNNIFSMNTNNCVTLNGLYPSIYKIVWPVIQKVISGNNYQFITEEIVNNTVDVVFGIVEGDVNSVSEKENNTETTRRQQTSSNCMNNNNNNSSNNNNMNNASNNNSNNSLLRDLIKILVIRELLNRNNVRRFPFNNDMMMPYYINPNIMSPYMIN